MDDKIDTEKNPIIVKKKKLSRYKFKKKIVEYE